MIQYSLKCENDHSFDSWFASADAYDKLADNGMVSCAVCGSTKVSKAIMAPRVRTTKGKEAPVAPTLPTEKSAAEQAMAKMRAQVEQNSEYVGTNFATEARSMHLGDAPERAIFGEAKPEEAKSLIEDGIPVTPLPFMPTRKSN
ncbi:MAG: DUF1178 family protein [Rhodobacteraceae bacterium]|jgi:hypothetical protein|nr:DUF1178 family protein [Paracoccaceae bacterium]NCZ65680.1 DUF1178 family protein [Paracoccaceae bacterium]NDH72706.1 DUF1178 family protein [Paracoccaceae bacterium]